MSIEDEEDGVGDDEGGGLEVVAEPVRGSKKMRVNLRHNGSLIHVDTLNLFDAAARSKFTKAVVAKAETKFGPGSVAVCDVEALLMIEADKLDDAEPEERGPAEAEYLLVTADNDPDRHGMFRHQGEKLTRLTNFTMKVEHDLQIQDEAQQVRRFEGSIRLDGRDHPFAIAATDFADARKLQATIFASAGPKARLIGDPTLIRDAISSISEPVSVQRTTALGWNADGSAYLFPSGLVDRDGFRPYRDGELRIDPGMEGPQRWLDLRGLTPQGLAGAKEHLVEEFYQLHGRPVMATLLGSVALAALERHSGNTQRVVIWLKGLTGAGKSFPAKLAMGFFGDYDPRHGDRFVSWSSTGNFIQQTGFYFRDALYLVDDFKPEIVQAAQAVRILQTYSDWAGRGRLQADAKANVTRPIRGLLISTGEDLPQNNASAVARTIIVDVPNRAKDHALGARCLEMWPTYRGVMADFLRSMIAEGRTADFAERVRQHRDRFYEGIAGQPNDARIAGNFALLAASFQEFARYMGDSWPDRKTESRAYLEEDLPAMRDRMLGLVRQQQASVIFLDVLRELVAYKRVRFAPNPACPPDVDGSNGGISGTHDGVLVGMLGQGDTYELAPGLALAAVQSNLRERGREELKVSESTLLEQLIADGAVLPVEPRDGKKTRQRRIEGDRLRCVLIKRSAIREGGFAVARP